MFSFWSISSLLFYQMSKSVKNHALRLLFFGGFFVTNIAKTPKILILQLYKTKLMLEMCVSANHRYVKAVSLKILCFALSGFVARKKKNCPKKTAVDCPEISLKIPKVFSWNSPDALLKVAGFVPSRSCRLSKCCMCSAETCRAHLFWRAGSINKKAKAFCGILPDKYDLNYQHSSLTKVPVKSNNLCYSQHCEQW